MATATLTEVESESGQTSDTETPSLVEALPTNPDPDPVADTEELMLFATLLAGAVEQTQYMGMVERNVTLIVIGALFCVAVFVLYRSVPTGAVRDKIGQEIVSSAGAVISGLKPVAKLTATDIDDDVLDWLSAKLEARKTQLPAPPLPDAAG
ncbi:MAG: hypothetical protein MUF38_06460 [Anaerolineae bacterium]|nr:hypothetical protein [Anaerolineae bacterium]